MKEMMKSKTLKRLIASVLAFVMVFTGLPFGGFMTREAHAAPVDPIFLDRGINGSKGSVSGLVYYDKRGGSGTVGNLTPTGITKPDSADEAIGGVKLFMKWMDHDGVESPVYTFNTVNDGTFLINVPQFVDAMGRTHTFSATQEQQMRLWVDEQWLDDNGYGVIMDWAKGKYANWTSPAGPGWLYEQGTAGRIANWWFALGKTDTMQMHLPEDQWVFTPTPDNAQPGLIVTNSVKGTVWWDWEYTPYLNNRPEKNSKDPVAAGVKVILTIADKNGNKIKTYYTTTNADGDYRITLAPAVPANAWQRPEIDLRNSFMSIETPEHAAAWSAYSTLLEYENPELNRDRRMTASVTGVSNEVRNANFALIPKALHFNIVEFDAQERFATAGHTATTSTTGLAPNSGVYKIVWSNVKTGEVLETYENLVPKNDGTLIPTTMKVPDNLKENTLFQAALYSPAGDQLSRDVFLAVTATAKTPVGAELAEYPEGQVNSPGIENHNYTYEVDLSPEAVAAGFGNLPAGLKLDPNTGQITGTPAAKTAGAHKVRYIVKGQLDPAIHPDAPAYSQLVDDTIYILDGNIAGPAMEGTAVDPNKVKLTITGKDDLPQGSIVKTTMAHLPVVVTFGGAEGDEIFGGAPAIDGDDLTTTHDVDITYTVTYPDPKDPTKTITDTVTQKKKPFVVLEKITLTGPLPNGKVGATYTATPTVVGGEGPYTYTATGLPAGLAIDETTGKITGTPTTKADYPVKITVKDNHGYTATLEQIVKIEDPQPSRLPIDLKQDVKNDGKGTQILTGKVDAFAQGEGTLGWVVELTDVDGVVLTYIDPKDNVEKPITGTVNPNGTFEFNIEEKGLAHDQEVRVQLTEPNKLPKVSTELVKLDLQGPNIEEDIATLKDGTMTIKAKTDDPNAGFVVQVGEKVYPAKVDANGNISATINASSPDAIKIIGVDTLGNMTVKEVKKPDPQLEKIIVQVQSIYAGNRRATMFTSRHNADVTYEIKRAGKIVQNGTFKTSNVGRGTLTLTEGRFALGDELIVEASITDSLGVTLKSDIITTLVTQ